MLLLSLSGTFQKLFPQHGMHFPSALPGSCPFSLQISADLLLLGKPSLTLIRNLGLIITITVITLYCLLIAHNGADIVKVLGG